MSQPETSEARHSQLHSESEKNKNKIILWQNVYTMTFFDSDLILVLEEKHVWFMMVPGL